jgi:biopolymer transport protein ExbD
MKVNIHRETYVRLESIALTDIILNIFIFFFISFSLVYTFNPTRESRIIVKLPQADIKAPVDQTEPIIINITSRNEIFLKNKSRTLIDLRREVQSLIAFNKTRPCGSGPRCGEERRSGTSGHCYRREAISNRTPPLKPELEVPNL